ncbi:Ethylene-insensitive protein 2 [Sarracenia purpurea var. burkii]
MDNEILTAKNRPSIMQRLLPAVFPVLLIAIGYVDPGKWAAAVEGGSRFGSDLVLLMLVFNFAAILCQYLSAYIAVVTGRDLSQNDGSEKIFCMLVASFILLFYVLGLLFSQPEISISITGTLTKLSGESAFALMSLLGASIMPHNFYRHSSIVQQELGRLNVSKGLLCHDHFFAILCIFSGIFLVNCVLMNMAANVFYSTGLVILTFQDALSLIDQVFRSSIVPFVFLLVMFVSNQITALSSNLGGQSILHDFFGTNIPSWLHHLTIRIIAIIPALFSVCNSGAEGIYQLLILTQVVIALMLPSSVIPLFRIASSRSIMGIYKVSHFVEFLARIMFIGMLGLKIIFLVELVFGNCDWLGNLSWNLGSSMSISYISLLITASTLLCLMLWLAATPLKSDCSTFDAHVWNQDIIDALPDSSTEREESDFIETRYDREGPIQKQEPALVPRIDLNLFETVMDSDTIPHLTSSADNGSNIAFPSHGKSHLDEPTTTVETVGISTVHSEDSVSEAVDTIPLKAESTGIIENPVRIEGDLRIGKDDEGDTWEEPEESSKGRSGDNPSLTSDGPGSYKNLSGKSEDFGSGAGSLLRLSGLGRAARRQLAAVLDEFWGQLFDFHGQATQESKARKLDMLLEVDPKLATSLKMGDSPKEFTGYFPSAGGRGSGTPVNTSVYDSSKLLTSYGVQRGSSSSSWLSHLLLPDSYVQNASHNALDDNERRYSSLRLPSPSDGNDYQPATVHGYQIASYLSRITKEKSYDYLNGQTEAPSPKPSSPLDTSIYRDPVAFASGRKLQYRLSPMKPPGFSDPVVSRNISSKSERPVNDLYSPGSRPALNLNNTINTKKFHSLPDISGLALPHRDSYSSDMSDQYSSIGYGVGAHLESNKLSLPKLYRDPFTLQFSSSSDTGSLWSKQPFEQFGSSDKTCTVGREGIGSKQNSISSEITSVLDLESKLLQSFRNCIIKLLKLEGSDWLFKQNDGTDEDLIDLVAARERYLYEADTREKNSLVYMDESQYSFDKKPFSALKKDETDYTNFVVSSVPHCGESCVWRVDLIISFGVWCIHRVLELSRLESRPELWGKYTYVLNRLQGIIEPAFSKPRTPMTPCFCLQIPGTHRPRSSPPPISNGGLPPPSKQGKVGKCTTAPMLLEIIKEIENAISCRKGRSGTAAGDVAFPKGKENLASVLKRYKRRLSNKPVGGSHEGGGGSGSRRVPASTPYGL